MKIFKKSLLILTLACMPMGSSVFGLKRPRNNDQAEEANKRQAPEPATPITIDALPSEMLTHIAGFLADPNKPCAQWQYGEDGKINGVVDGNVPVVDAATIAGITDKAITKDVLSLLFIALQDHEKRDLLLSQFGMFDQTSQTLNGTFKLNEWAFMICDIKTMLMLDRYTCNHDQLTTVTVGTIDGHDLAYYAVVNNNQPVLAMLLDYKPARPFYPECLLDLAIQEKKIELIDFLCPRYVKFLADGKNALLLLRVAFETKDNAVLTAVVEILKKHAAFTDKEIASKEMYHLIDDVVKTKNEERLILILQGLKSLDALSEKMLFIWFVDALVAKQSLSFMKILLDSGAPVAKIFPLNELEGFTGIEKKASEAGFSISALHVIVSTSYHPQPELRIRLAQLLMDYGANPHCECLLPDQIIPEQLTERSPIAIAEMKEDYELARFLKYYVSKPSPMHLEQ